MKGGRITLDTAEAVPVENISDSEMLMIWRYKAEMVQDGESFGSYYLDSNPFTVRLLKPETPSA